MALQVHEGAPVDRAELRDLKRIEPLVAGDEPLDVVELADEVVGDGVVPPRPVEPDPIRLVCAGRAWKRYRHRAPTVAGCRCATVASWMTPPP